MGKEFNADLVEKMIAYWVGKKDNPLNGKTFMEISQLGEHYGIDLGGLKNDFATE